MDTREEEYVQMYPKMEMMGWNYFARKARGHDSCEWIVWQSWKDWLIFPKDNVMKLFRNENFVVQWGKQDTVISKNPLLFRSYSSPEIKI